MASWTIFLSRAPAETNLSWTASCSITPEDMKRLYREKADISGLTDPIKLAMMMFWLEVAWHGGCACPACMKEAFEEAEIPFDVDEITKASEEMYEAGWLANGESTSCVQ